MGWSATAALHRRRALQARERPWVGAVAAAWPALELRVPAGARPDELVLAGLLTDPDAAGPVADALADLARRLGAELRWQDDHGVLDTTVAPALPEEWSGWARVGATAPRLPGILGEVPTHRALEPAAAERLAPRVARLEPSELLAAFEEDRGPEWRDNLRAVLAPLLGERWLAEGLAAGFRKDPDGHERDSAAIRLLGAAGTEPADLALLRLVREHRLRPIAAPAGATTLATQALLHVSPGHPAGFWVAVLDLAGADPSPVAWQRFASGGGDLALPLLDRARLRPTGPTLPSPGRSPHATVAGAVIVELVALRGAGRLSDRELGRRLEAHLAAPELVVRHAAASAGVRAGLPGFDAALDLVCDLAQRSGVVVPASPRRSSPPGAGPLLGGALGAGGFRSPPPPPPGGAVPVALGPWWEDLASLEPARAAQGLARASRQGKAGRSEPADALVLALYDELAEAVDARSTRERPLGTLPRAPRRTRGPGEPDALPTVLRDVLRRGAGAVAADLPGPEVLLPLTATERAEIEALERSALGAE